MKIAILGPGCAKCRMTEKVVRKAVEETGTEAVIYKIQDINEIMSYRFVMTPAVAINDKVRIAGKVPTVEEVKSLLSA
jgi:small redox-active disulfide protein 2